MHLSAGPEKPAGELDTHWFIDGPLEEFNEHMLGHFRSSHLFTMDETGPKWNGGEGENDFNKCPHVSFETCRASWSHSARSSTTRHAR